MPFGLKNAPSEFQKRMEDIFGGEEYIIVYIDDLLVFSKDVNSHKMHLETFSELVYKHGLVLSDSEEKFQIGKVRIDYLGLHIEQGQVNLQPHVLTHFLKFPNVIADVKKLQRFIGCLDYIRQFYEKQADDTKILQKRLKKQATGWTEEMTKMLRITLGLQYCCRSMEEKNWYVLIPQVHVMTLKESIVLHIKRY